MKDGRSDNTIVRITSGIVNEGGAAAAAAAKPLLPLAPAAAPAAATILRQVTVITACSSSCRVRDPCPRESKYSCKMIVDCKKSVVIDELSYFI